jgi:hypothetical protein
MVDVLVHRERHIRVRTVHRARRGKDEVLDAVVTAALEHVERADEIAVGIGMRVFDRVAHASLGTEMDRARNARGGKQRLHRGAVGEIDLLEPETTRPRKAGEPRPLERGIVVGIHVVEPDHFVASLEQALGHVVADESRRSR